MEKPGERPPGREAQARSARDRSARVLAADEGPMPRAVYILTGVFVFLLGAVIAAANDGRLRVELLFGEVELTTGQWLVIAFLLGWGVGVAAAWRFVRRLTSERADLRRNLRLAEAELKNLRAVPHDGA